MCASETVPCSAATTAQEKGAFVQLLKEAKQSEAPQIWVEVS